MDTQETQVTHNAGGSRFDISLNGKHVGQTEYHRRGDAFVFTHTEVDDAYEGQGLGSRLIRGALDEMRARGARVVPQCRFVKAFIDEHDEYADLVA